MQEKADRLLLSSWNKLGKMTHHCIPKGNKAREASSLHKFFPCLSPTSLDHPSLQSQTVRSLLKLLEDDRQELGSKADCPQRTTVGNKGVCQPVLTAELLSVKQDHQVQENLVWINTDSALPEQPDNPCVTTAPSSLSAGGTQERAATSNLAGLWVQTANMSPQSKDKRWRLAP